jgi:hypothetical protein
MAEQKENKCLVGNFMAMENPSLQEKLYQLMRD